MWALDARGPQRGPGARDVGTVCAVVWVGSVARVALGVTHHEAFGVELSLAVIALATLPWAALMKS